MRRGALVALLVAAPASAADTGIAADPFVAAPGPGALITVEGAEVPPPDSASATFALGYAANPLTLYNRVTGATVSHPVAGALAADVAAEVGLAPRLALGLGVPATLWARGDRLAAVGAGDERPLDGPHFGDVRLRAKLVLATGGRVRAALVGALTLPGGGERDFAATDGPTFEPRLVVDAAFARVTVAARAGVRFASARSLFGTRFGDTLEWGAGAAGGFARARLVVEAAGAVGSDVHPLELRCALRFLLPLGLSVDAGAGAGLLRQPTEPAWRLFLILRRG